MNTGKRYWWVPPTASSVLFGFGLPVYFALFVLSGFATDSCNGRDSCPKTFGHLDDAQQLLLFGLLAVTAQWVVAYWAPWAVRIVLAMVPIGLGFAALVMLMSTPVGQ
ncbi:hypothetical protein [Nocardia sp. NPDC059228]|uniref:hypothetical protein n=1 Tax=Nocardia sp. NPDC059228 TaxID=3346777 RepID=UPI00369E8611